MVASVDSSGDYILGTDEEELARLELQNQVWRPHVLKCWREGGIATGSHVLDVGAGPGYASADLAALVGDLWTSYSTRALTKIRRGIGTNDLPSLNSKYHSPSARPDVRRATARRL